MEDVLIDNASNHSIFLLLQVPLARKLETCGVFGVSSDEYLNYALANRDEWVRKGQDVVKELEEIVRRDYS